MYIHVEANYLTFVQLSTTYFSQSLLYPFDTKR